MKPSNFQEKDQLGPSTIFKVRISQKHLSGQSQRSTVNGSTGQRSIGQRSTINPGRVSPLGSTPVRVISGSGQGSGPVRFKSMFGRPPQFITNPGARVHKPSAAATELQGGANGEGGGRRCKRKAREVEVGSRIDLTNGGTEQGDGGRVMLGTERTAQQRPSGKPRTAVEARSELRRRWKGEGEVAFGSDREIGEWLQSSKTKIRVQGLQSVV
ncbi:hypothetical protein GQ457_17G007140 [Hibiscus cannabinus]